MIYLSAHMSQNIPESKSHQPLYQKTFPILYLNNDIRIVSPYDHIHDNIFLSKNLRIKQPPTYALVNKLLLQ